MQLFHRPRRLRKTDWSRRLVQENQLSSNDFIYPVFLLEGSGREETVSSMPGVSRLSLDKLMLVAEDCIKLGIPVMALSPVIRAERITYSYSRSVAPLPSQVDTP